MTLKLSKLQATGYAGGTVFSLYRREPFAQPVEKDPPASVCEFADWGKKVIGRSHAWCWRSKPKMLPTHLGEGPFFLPLSGFSYIPLMSALARRVPGPLSPLLQNKV
jgi:hypothetical protein